MTDSDAAALLGSADEVLEVVEFEDDGSASPTEDFGTEVRARSRLSIESRRSVANL